MHDLDLMYLYKMPNISIQSIVKVMLKNYIKDRNEGCHIATRLSIPDVKHDVPLPKTAQFHITLINGEDDDVISWIEQIPKGLRNSMLKNMLRSYLSFPVVIPYETEVTEVAKPTKKNDISIAKYNEVMENSVKSGKRKQVSRKKVTEDVETTVETVLNASLNSNIMETKEGIGDNFLSTNENVEKSSVSSSNNNIANMPVNTPVNTSTPNVTSIPKQNVTNTTKPKENNILNEPDLFDEFEALMDNF
jgi:hypothetical protein